MSCPAAPKLVCYYSNKINIYDNNCFIPLPNYQTCPPPPPFAYLVPPCGGNLPPNNLQVQKTNCSPCSNTLQVQKTCCSSCSNK